MLSGSKLIIWGVITKIPDYFAFFIINVIMDSLNQQFYIITFISVSLTQCCFVISVPEKQ